MMRVLILTALLFGLLTGLVSPFRVEASPGLCTGPVCADDITRSAKNHWQLVLKLNDQLGHREKVVMNCRAGQLSPMSGPVDRAYATAIGRRACRLAGEG
ncbi:MULTISPECIES: hypothetical protein [unclassified Synechococcus]|uniref:hypothetical protein n=1 Tax=unclassified Synechococcus TaxID=2626047 RepID=UPI000C49B693|nr:MULTISPECIES: hypothetical protein [unclassified Synechococcus]MAN19454.1 hypothetical protein [Synechococcus sp. EAC657]MEC7248599.1 hypothetical protein [Cyanobacteriota bacterium]MEC7896784.1 hypothetical protein [Cyanobacteriota bacterium]QNI48410.1 putative conserved secreted protein [Synechococcus sp. A15-60]|tara:strand:+ start:1363 stop:1662 length:300 start_codon:yes stop_codon:yes gene_type:complete